MLFPSGTDAALDHRPWATGALIAANVAVVAGFGFAGPATWGVLEFGAFQPHAWITSTFLHADALHLLGNMIFLWTFGMIAEGYLGPWRFLGVFAALAAAEGLATQILMIRADSGGAVGASGVVYGLMAIAALWAPRNRVYVWMWWWRGPDRHEFSVWGFCMSWIVLDLFQALLAGGMSTSLLHLLGAGAGAAAGVWLLKRGDIDTEGWDYLSLREHGPPRRGVAPTAPAPPLDPRAAALVDIRDALEAGRAVEADDRYRRAQRELDGFTLPAPDLRALADALRGVRLHEAALERVEELMTATPGPPPPDLAVARIELLLACGRPARAAEALRSTRGLEPEQHARLEARIREERRSGLELE